jgi:hypothetical protein
MAVREVSIGYQANPKQKDAHGLSAKYRGFCGGWGNGKTSWGCVEFFTSLWSTLARTASSRVRLALS